MDNPAVGQPVNAFLERLASEAPTPGGGSAAGLVGAMAAALVAMVARLTLDKKGYEAVQDRMHELVRQADETRRRLLALMAQDEAAFEAVMAAYRLPKETEGQKSLRRERLQAALRTATEVPYQTAQATESLLALALEAARDGNKNAVSDAGAAAHLARAAAEAALLNVDTNLSLLKDERFKAEYRRKRDELVQGVEARHAQVVQAVRAKLS